MMARALMLKASPGQLSGALAGPSWRPSQVCLPKAGGSHTFQGFYMSSQRNVGVARATQSWTEQPTRKELMHEAMERLTEQDLEATVQKYNLEEELFAEIDFAQIDAFTDKAFGGNPAAVCYLPMWRDDTWLQNVAKEFNLSETAFLVRRRTTGKAGKKGGGGPLEKDEDGSLKAVKKFTPQIDGNEFDLRWFTPTMEVDLCGHATLAAAHLLFSAGLVEDDITIFHTRSGALTARRIRDESKDSEAPGPNGSAPPANSKGKASVKRARPPARTTIELDFPELIAEEWPRSDWLGLEALLLGGEWEVLWAGATKTSLPYVLVEVASERAVREYIPDIGKLAAFTRGCLVLTARADDDSQFDFVSRFFAPLCGLPEDPVTGSAHCMLGPYWATKLDKLTLEAFQASERGGHVTVHWSKKDKRVQLRGTSVTVMAGMLLNTTNTPTTQ